MKKLLSVLVVVACLVSCLSVCVSAERIYDGYTTAIKGTPVIDAELDDIWLQTEKQDIALWCEEFASMHYTDTTGTFRVMWDDSFLYVFVEVDKKGMEVYPGDETWSTLSNTDNVLVLVSQGLFDGYEDVANGANSDAGGFRCTAGGLMNGLGLMYSETEDRYTAAAQITTSSTYQCEFAIPWNEYKPAENTEIGMEIQLNVNIVGDDKRYTVVEWAETPACEAWNNTAYMSTVKLIGAPAVADVPVDTAPADTTPVVDTPVDTAPATFDATVVAVASMIVTAGTALVVSRKRK